MDFKPGGALDVEHVHIHWLYSGYVYACEQADEKVFITVMHNARADGDGLFSWLSNAHGVCMASPTVLSPIKCASWDEDRPTKKGIEVWCSHLEKRFGRSHSRRLGTGADTFGARLMKHGEASSGRIEFPFPLPLVFQVVVFFRSFPPHRPTTCFPPFLSQRSHVRSHAPVTTYWRPACSDKHFAML